MTANTDSPSPLRSAVIRECAAEFSTPLAQLLDVARVYGHTLQCAKCRKFTVAVGNVLADAARRVGEIVRGWRPLGVNIEHVMESDSREITLLLAACHSAPEFTDGNVAPAQARIDWQTALGLAGLAFSLRVGKSRTPCQPS